MFTLRQAAIARGFLSTNPLPYTTEPGIYRLVPLPGSLAVYYRHSLLFYRTLPAPPPEFPPGRFRLQSNHVSLPLAPEDFLFLPPRMTHPSTYKNSKLIDFCADALRLFGLDVSIASFPPCDLAPQGGALLVDRTPLIPGLPYVLSFPSASI